VLLRDTDSFDTWEQNLVNNHGEFLKHYRTAHQSYLSIYSKSLKSFSNLEHNIKSILEYNHYRTSPIIIKSRNTTTTTSQNFFYKVRQFCQTLFFRKRYIEGSYNELDDSIIISSVEVLIDDLVDLQNEIDTALHNTQILRKYSDVISDGIDLVRYDIENSISYHERPLGNVLYMMRYFKIFDTDKETLEGDLKKYNYSKGILNDLNSELENLSRNFTTSKEYFESYQGYLKGLWEDMKVIEKKELNEWEVKRFKKVLNGIKENHGKCLFLLSLFDKN